MKQRWIPREGEARTTILKISKILKDPPLFDVEMCYNPCRKMDLVVWKMDLVVYQTLGLWIVTGNRTILGHWIVIGNRTILGHWIVIDKRTTHASGTPLDNIDTYYTFFTFYTIISKYYREQPQG